MSSLDDISTCGDGGEIPKECTSYDQKVEDIKNDETSNNSADVDLSGALHHLRQFNLRSGTNNNENEDDKLLFQDPPPKEDCQICMQPMPFYTNSTGMRGAQPMYQPCCGKLLCTGCMVTSVKEMHKGNMKRLCPFCRIPMITSTKEYVKRLRKRIDLDDAEAFCCLGLAYKHTKMGVMGYKKITGRDFNC